MKMSSMTNSFSARILINKSGRKICAELKKDRERGSEAPKIFENLRWAEPLPHFFF